MQGDGRIYQRGARFYIAYSIGGREFRESTASGDPADAQRLLVERCRHRAQAAAAVVAAQSPATFDDLAAA